MLDKYSMTMWPTPRCDPPSADALELIGFLESQGSGPPRWDPASPWVVRLPTSVVEGDEEIAAWLRSSRPSTRYFFERNPHYREGGAFLIWQARRDGGACSGAPRVDDDMPEVMQMRADRALGLAGH
jgi:hypothetical protein